MQTCGELSPRGYKYYASPAGQRKLKGSIFRTGGEKVYFELARKERACYQTTALGIRQAENGYFLQLTDFKKMKFDSFSPSSYGTPVEWSENLTIIGNGDDNIVFLITTAILSVGRTSTN